MSTIIISMHAAHTRISRDYAMQIEHSRCNYRWAYNCIPVLFRHIGTTGIWAILKFCSGVCFAIVMKNQSVGAYNYVAHIIIIIRVIIYCMYCGQHPLIDSCLYTLDNLAKYV